MLNPLSKAVALIAAMLFATAAASQAYPSKPVKLVVPFPAGSATDQVARVSGQILSEALGQTFVIENKPGAQGAIGAEAVAHSAPDGYTILVTTNTTQAANVSLFKKLPYDPVKDFAPVARLGTTSFMLMVKPEFPAKTLKDFVALAKSRNGKISGGYGSAGSQVSLAMLKTMGGFDVTDVPYKGIPQALTDVIGGTLDFTFVDLGNAMAQAKGGKLRGLGVTSEKRSALAPDIPAIAETLNGYELIAWFGLMAPAGTPKDIVAKLHDAVVKGLLRPEMRERFATIGTDVAPLNPEQLAKFIDSEIAKWKRLTREAGIQPE